jgi:hypothetical protein
VAKVALAAVLVTLFLTSCLPREGRNSACQWPPDHPDASLRADLEFAEDLAIRYMDETVGPRDPTAAAQAKNRCMGSLLGALAPRHGLTAQQAFQSFGKRSLAIDLAINLPFALLFALAAHALQRRFRALAFAIALAAVAILLAQFWTSSIESLRLGTSHLSNRTLRLPAVQHPAAVFTIALAIVFATRPRSPKPLPQPE